MNGIRIPQEQYYIEALYVHYTRIHSFLERNDSPFKNLSYNQQQIFLQIVREGGLVNLSIPEFLNIYDDKGVEHRLTPSSGHRPTPIRGLDSITAADISAWATAGVERPNSKRSTGQTLAQQTTVAVTGHKADDEGGVSTHTIQFTPVIPFKWQPDRLFTHGPILVRAGYETTTNNPIPDSVSNVDSNDELSDSQKLDRYTNWSPLINKVEGLTHLANKQVSVFADNETISNPLTQDERFKDQILTVDADGVLELPDYYQWGLVGLPYLFEMESLQIEAQDDRTLIAGKKVVNKLSLALHRSREGIHVSSIRNFEYDEAEDQAYPIYDEKIREQSIDPMNKTFSGAVEPFLASGWSEGGRVRITNSDPTPVTVNAIYPKGIESGD